MAFSKLLRKHTVLNNLFPPLDALTTTRFQKHFLPPSKRDRAKVLQPWLYLCFNRKYIPNDIQGSYLRVMVEVGGVEPPSESTLTGLSPGADGYCGSLSPCSPSGWQAVTPSGQVRVIMRGRGNSYPPHGRHINDAFPGLWPLRFRRPPLIRQQ